MKIKKWFACILAALCVVSSAVTVFANEIDAEEPDMTVVIDVEESEEETEEISVVIDAEEIEEETDVISVVIDADADFVDQEEALETEKKPVELADDADSLNPKQISHVVSDDWHVVVNPLYEDVVDPAELIPAIDVSDAIQAASSTTTYEVGSVQEAGALVRNTLKAREETISFVFQIPYPADFGAWCDETSEQIIDIALEHTGIPTEGDYIKYQYGGYATRASATGTSDTLEVTLTYTFQKYYTDAAMEAEMDQRVSYLMSLFGFTSSTTTIEKLDAIYNYICSHVTYDNVHKDDESYKKQYTAYAALIDGTSVCQGYANLFYRLALEAGVDARIIDGFGGGEPHAWNIAELNGIYYLLDSTWDSATWEVYQDFDHYEYYMRGSDFFYSAEGEHTPSAGFTTDEFLAKYPIYNGILITGQPEDFKGSVGTTAVFHVEAEGENLSYQWQWSKNGASWSNSSSSTVGYNTDTLKVAITEARNGYHYRCVVSKSSGQQTVSSAAVLSVEKTSEPLEITSQPSNYTGPIGGTAVFKVTATGTGLKYQWQWSKNGTTWTNSTSSTVGYNTNTLSVGITSTRNGYRYRCVVTDTNGNEAISTAAKLTVAAGVAITSQPSNYTGPIGGTAVFKVTATGTGLKYQWQWSKNGTTWTNSSSATVGYNTNTLSVGITSTRNGYRYRCVVTDTYGNEAISTAAKLTVAAGVAITSQPSNYTGPIEVLRYSR